MSVTLYQGDNCEVLPTLPAASVQCIVTSPPYFGLRDYGLPPTAWPAIEYAPMAGLPPVTVPAMVCCLGLESDPLAYIGHLVHVFRLARPALADDGVAWLNLGDSYIANAATAKGKDVFQSYRGSETPTLNKEYQGRVTCRGNGLKCKDLLGIPWRAAFALQADGWYLRSDVIWSKPNCMPESVTDRPTRSHEHVFLLSKQPHYFYNGDSIREQGGPPKPRGRKVDASRNDGDRTGFVLGDGVTRNKRTVWTVAPTPYAGAHYAVFPEKLVEPCILAGSRPGDIVLDPFGGSGTVGRVALRHNRKAWLIELNPAYVEQQERRVDGVQPFLAGLEAA